MKPDKEYTLILHLYKNLKHMKKHLIVLILLFSGIRAVSQKISQLITQDTITYVYKLDNAQSKYVL
ncbi:MAG TPA: hypothetical protein DCF44_03690, partial [Chitinophagaceae bacterium]|nr:hypothetical protein [Chitinophagaceae bacterium]